MTPLSSATQRIDPPRVGPGQPTVGVATDSQSTSRAGRGELRRMDRAHAIPANQEAVPGPERDETGLDASDRDDWLDLQARDLIERLRRWAADLDAREAQLNSAMAQQDLRERQFRIRQQESEAAILRQQAAIDALRNQLSAQARRLAFQIG